MLCSELQGNTATSSYPDNGCHASEGKHSFLITDFILFFI